MSIVPSDLRFTQIHKLVEKCRLTNHGDVDDLSRRLRRGVYCLILGPRFSEKSFLLDDLATVLKTDPHIACVRLDLGPLRHEAGGQFIRRFAATLNAAASTRVALPRTEAQLVQFLQAVPAALRTHVVLLLDHLELLPVNDIIILLSALRGAFGEQRGRSSPFPLTCAATTSFAVANLTFGPNSPFNEGYQLWVRDLDRDESRRLFANFAQELDVDVDEQFFDRLFAATSGDRYLIALLCNCCAKIAAAQGRRELTLSDLAAAEEWFFKHAADYPPLQETTRALEQPDILRMFMQVLAAERIEEKGLEIRGDKRSDELRLTGAVRLVTEDGRTFYEARNELVCRYMVRHYHPVRVARVSFMAGRFDEAVAYLENQPGLREDRRLRTALLEAVVSAINVASTVEEAVEHLAERIAHAFNLESAAVFIVSPDLTYLDCKSVHGRKARRIRLAEQQSIVFREGQYRMKHETQRLTLVLTSRNDVRFGVLDVHGFRGDAQSEEFSDILAVTRLIGWALSNVLERERLIRQFQKLDVTGRKLGSLDLEYVLQAIVDAGVEAVGGAQRGILLLYDETEELLRVRSFSKGRYRANIREAIRLGRGQGYAGKAFESGQALVIPDAQNDDRVLLRNDEDIGKQKSVVCAPLFVWGRAIGVFILDNVTQLNAFRDEDMDLLAGFAAQAASALQTSMVLHELHQLSIKVNRGDLSARDIFLAAARSIVHVTGAFAANMLLLPDADDAERAVKSKPLLSVAYKLPEDFEKNIGPREDGLTFRTLRDRRLSICSEPEDAPGINQLASDANVRASIALPLSVQEQIRGVLFVHHRDEHEFSPDEQHVLSIFANLCAEAIEESRHAEQLRIHGSVAWMGLDLSEMWHTFVQVIPRLRNYFFNLKLEIRQIEAAHPWVTQIDGAIEALAAVRDALLPVHEKIERVEITELVKTYVEERCKAHEKVSRDFSNLGNTLVYVRCDSSRLGKVVKCLTENAVRAANERPKPMISVALRNDARNVEILMTNNGAAIDPDVRENLFRNPVRSSGGGRGVGLLIARSIVTGYGGDLAFVSSKEDETIFRLSLPRLREQEAS